MVPPKAVIGEVTFVNTPICVAVTLTEKVQDAPPASVAPLKVRTFDAATAVIVPASQEPVRPFGVETINPAGSVSKKAMPVKGVEFGLVIVKLNAIVSPGPSTCNCD